MGMTEVERRALMRGTALTDMDPTETPVDAKIGADLVGLSLSAFWKAVRIKRLPAPVYPLPRAPRWYPSELRAAALATRALPTEQKATRRAATIAGQQQVTV